MPCQSSEQLEARLARSRSVGSRLRASFLRIDSEQASERNRTMNPRQSETVLCERHAQDRAWLDRRPAGRPLAILRELRLRTVEVIVDDQCARFQGPVSVRAFFTGARIPMDLVLSARAAIRLNPERELSAGVVSCSALEFCAVAPVLGRLRARHSGGTGRRDDRCGEREHCVSLPR